MADKEKLAYIVGMALAIGFILALKKRGLSFDANTNNPYWITTENGHHYLIDEEGTIQSGRFKGNEIGAVGKLWKKEKRKEAKLKQPKMQEPQHYKDNKFFSAEQYASIMKMIDEHKYDNVMPNEPAQYINAMVEHRDPTKNEKKARPDFKSSIEQAVKEQPAEIQKHIKAFKFNMQGATPLEYVDPGISKQLGLTNSKKVMVPLLTVQRELGKHRDMTREMFEQGLAYAFMAEGAEIVRLKSDHPNYYRFAIKYKSKTYGDVIVDLEDKNTHYDVVHFHRNKEKNVRKDIV